MKKICSVFFIFIFALIGRAVEVAPASGATVAYQLPGTPGTTWRVTLAITDATNPDWIVSAFVAGAPRTVTAENGGRFTETWNGLDDNFMPVPPGDYSVKGIFMPAREWRVDGEWHSITPRFVTGASAWMPSPDDLKMPEPFGGDPCGQPLADVAVGPNGVAVFYYEYLENGHNCPMFDLKKPEGIGQFIQAFPSGGAGGGTSAATDGETVWAFSTDGGPKYVYRADGKSFGSSPGANRSNSYPPEGWVTAMAAWRNATGESFVGIAQRGKIIEPQKRRYEESETEFANKVTIHDGENGKVLAELPIEKPQGLAVQGGSLFALHADGANFAISSMKLSGGLPAGSWRRVFAIPPNIHPSDFEVDSHGRFYVSDSQANKVFQFDRGGKILRTFGKLDAQKPGNYDRETFIAPEKLATWTTPNGEDRLIVVENGGPNRASEWNADGKLIREFLSLQTKCNDGYAIDPENPSHIYIQGQQHWLTRFKIDYEKHNWTVDAVWPGVGDDPRAPRFDKPQFIRRDGREYLACGRSLNIYRHDGDRWIISAAIIRERTGNEWRTGLWHDENGNGRVDDDEIAWSEFPGHFLTYHGQNWLDDLSLVAMNQGGDDVWRLAPDHFDSHGNPVFKEFKRLFGDPVFAARREEKSDAIHGGNELAETFPSDWMQTDGSLDGGFYVQARGGKNFSANEGAQHKISHYVPDGSGGFKLKWRTGRTALQGIAQPDEMYGGMRIHRPVNGLVSVVDQSRCGVLLYTEDGLYVDTLFLDGRRFHPKDSGVYPLPGEFFAGSIFPNRDNGKIYFAAGKVTPLIFEMENWSLKENPVRPLTTLQKTVRITAAQIAAPPEIALSLRGGAGAAKFAHIAPALGGAALDGSLDGWDSCEPVTFAADKDQSVEVRCLYDPDHLYFRWHAQLSAKFEAKLLQPIERIFSHDRLADTLSFCIQGDANAPAGGPAEGRRGDARFVLGIFNDGGAVKPVALGMHPQWSGANPRPQVYRTPVGEARFAHVGPVAGAQLFHKLDDDGKGFVLVAAIPRTAIPLIAPFAGGARTMVNFSATFGGHNKFWWANSDGSASRETYDEPTEARLYPGSWAPAEFKGLEGGVVIRNWLLCGPWGGAGTEKFAADLRDHRKDEARKSCEAARYPPDDGKVDMAAVFTGESVRGYWHDPGPVRWKPARIADLDTRVICGPSAQVWFGATWIHAPAETQIDIAFQGHRQTFLRWSLNGVAVPGDENKRDDRTEKLVVKKTITLRPGWNQLTFRGYCIGYPPFRAGAVLDAPAATLWKLKFSAAPPPP